MTLKTVYPSTFQRRLGFPCRKQVRLDVDSSAESRLLLFGIAFFFALFDTIQKAEKKFFHSGIILYQTMQK